MGSHFTAVYDACVLYPAPLRDLLMHLAMTDLVTFNLKDFPAAAMSPYNLTAQHPDDFILDLLDLYPARVLEAAANHRRSLKNPPKTVQEYLDTLLKQGLPQSVAVLRQWGIAL